MPKCGGDKKNWKQFWKQPLSPSSPFAAAQREYHSLRLDKLDRARRGFRPKICFEWSAIRICTRACLIFNILQWSRRRDSKQTIEICGWRYKRFRKTKVNEDRQQLQDDIDKLSCCLTNGRCYLVLRNANVYMQGMGTRGWTMKREELLYVKL